MFPEIDHTDKMMGICAQFVPAELGGQIAWVWIFCNKGFIYVLSGFWLFYFWDYC